MNCFLVLIYLLQGFYAEKILDIILKGQFLGASQEIKFHNNFVDVELVEEKQYYIGRVAILMS